VTDVTAASNNQQDGGAGAHVIFLTDGNSFADSPQYPYSVPVGTITQNFVTPFVFSSQGGTGGLYVLEHSSTNPNNNEWVTVTGYYFFCSF
jgi:hypothetical protein